MKEIKEINNIYEDKFMEEKTSILDQLTNPYGKNFWYFEDENFITINSKPKKKLGIKWGLFGVLKDKDNIFKKYVFEWDFVTNQCYSNPTNEIQSLIVIDICNYYFNTYIKQYSLEYFWIPKIATIYVFRDFENDNYSFYKIEQVEDETYIDFVCKVTIFPFYYIDNKDKTSIISFQKTTYEEIEMDYKLDLNNDEFEKKMKKFVQNSLKNYTYEDNEVIDKVFYKTTVGSHILLMDNKNYHIEVLEHASEEDFENQIIESVTDYICDVTNRKFVHMIKKEVNK